MDHFPLGDGAPARACRVRGEEFRQCGDQSLFNQGCSFWPARSTRSTVERPEGSGGRSSKHTLRPKASHFLGDTSGSSQKHHFWNSGIFPTRDVLDPRRGLARPPGALLMPSGRRSRPLRAERCMVWRCPYLPHCLTKSSRKSGLDMHVSLWGDGRIHRSNKYTFMVTSCTFRENREQPQSPHRLAADIPSGDRPRT